MVLNSSFILKSIYSLYGDICWDMKDTFLSLEHSAWSGSLDFPVLKNWDSPAHRKTSKTIKLEDGGGGRIQQKALNASYEDNLDARKLFCS